MYLLADIGGTKTRITVSEDLHSFQEPMVYHTPQEYEAGIRSIENFIFQMSIKDKITAVCVGVSGILQRDKSTLVVSPHLRHWEGKKLQRDLQTISGTEHVYLENDTALVGLGEALHGAGKGFDLVTYMTFSTGVGGAQIEYGKIDDRAFGFEPGHQLIVYENGTKSLESLTSGSGIMNQFNEIPEDNTEFWNQAHEYVAIGIHNTILHWSPEVVVLGGGLILHDRYSVDAINVRVQELLSVFPESPVIRKAELGDFGGLYGAMEHIENSYVRTVSL